MIPNRIGKEVNTLETPVANTAALSQYQNILRPRTMLYKNILNLFLEYFIIKVGFYCFLGFCSFYC